jgi:hypothetical protein
MKTKIERSKTTHKYIPQNGDFFVWEETPDVVRLQIRRPFGDYYEQWGDCHVLVSVGEIEHFFPNLAESRGPFTKLIPTHVNEHGETVFKRCE